jgi:hypothetical protein
MKALKSPLAKQLLSDPRTREQLRQVPSGTGETRIAETRSDNGRTQHYVVRVVPKAA